VKISVSDDFGVDQIKLVYNKLGGEQHRVEAQAVSENKGEVVATAELDLSSMELKEYELVAYHAEATDNNTLDGPGTGKSPVYFIEITDEESGESLAQGQGQKVNLLVIQKQIVADTTALPKDGATDKFKEMSVRQRDAADFGRMYLDAISTGDAEAAVTKCMPRSPRWNLRVLTDNNSARTQFHTRKALAHLYQVVKPMPELENMLTQPTLAKSNLPTPRSRSYWKQSSRKKRNNPTTRKLKTRSTRPRTSHARRPA
jgi:hypothetical protein